jgi:choline dehydrogenase-like flavoprotein
MRIMARGLEHNPFARVTLTEADMERMADLVPQGGHHIGTTRMGVSPNEGVTDEYGRVWNSRNLYIAGSALFPRSGAANPTLMIVALALRAAAFIAGRERERDIA